MSENAPMTLTDLCDGTVDLLVNSQDDVDVVDDLAVDQLAAGGPVAASELVECVEDVTHSLHVVTVDVHIESVQHSHRLRH